MDFWDHMETLRSCLLKAVVAAVVAAVAAFCFKGPLFAVVLAPSTDAFVTYRLLARVTGFKTEFHVALFNPELAQQFVVHMRVALWAGVLAVSPYVVYLLFRFVSPGLYRHERRSAVRAVTGGSVMFLAGVALNYFLIFPLAFRFLGTYQVDPSVPNQISLTSYVDMLLLLCLLMGVVFELPVVAWLLARVGLLRSQPMRSRRRQAVVAVLVAAAVITPTGDAMTLALVALPVYALYEASIGVVRREERRQQRGAA